MKNRVCVAIIVVATVAIALGSSDSRQADAARRGGAAEAGTDAVLPMHRQNWRAELMGGNAESCAHAAASSMMNEDLVRQLFVVGKPAAGTGDRDEARSVGGFILMGRSSAGAEATAKIVDRLRRSGNSPTIRPFVVVDQEGGKVQVLAGRGFSTIPSAEEQGRLPARQLERAAGEWGAELSAAAISWALAPVADVVARDLLRKNRPIGVPRRSFSTDPSIVAGSADAVSRGMIRAGVLPTFKHFPGLGAVVGNTDYEAGVVDRSTDARSPSVEVYRKLLVSSPQVSVMISTAVYSKLDGDVPAVFSRHIITDLLRGEIAFRGIVVSDDLASAKQVSKVPLKVRGTRFIEAGGDVVIGVDSKAAGEMIEGAVAKGAADPGFLNRVRSSAIRVLTVKATLGLLNCAAISG